MQLKLFDKLNANITGEISLVDVFESYLQCRQNKRNTANAIAFEIDYEQNLITLWREINEGTYRPNRSIAFIIEYLLIFIWINLIITSNTIWESDIMGDMLMIL